MFRDRLQSMSYTSGNAQYGSSPSVSHRLDHEVSLEGAGRRVAGADTNDYPAGVQRTGVQIVSGVLSREHVHMFVEIPPHIAVSDFVRRVKGRSSHRVQMEFPDLRATGGGISGLGATSPPERQHDGRCHTSVSSGARTYRRPPVVIQCPSLLRGQRRCPGARRATFQLSMRHAEGRCCVRSFRCGRDKRCWALELLSR